MTLLAPGLRGGCLSCSATGLRFRFERTPGRPSATSGGTPVFGDDMPRSSIGRFLIALPLALLILSIAPQAFAAWPTTPSGTPVSVAPPRNDGPPLAVSDSCGG